MSLRTVESVIPFKSVKHGFGCALFYLAAGLMSTAVADDSLSSPHDVQIQPDAPFPSMVFSDLLKSMSDQVFWQSGKLRFFERVRMTFLPEFSDPSHIAGYNPDSGAFLVSQVIDSDSNADQTVFWEARQERFPIWVGQARNNSDPDSLAPDRYRLVWTLDGQAFWEMDFEVTTSGASSAYESGHYQLEGPWAQWAYVYVPNGNLAQTPTFNLFIRDTSARPGQWTDQVIVVEAYRDGELVAQHGHNPGASRPASIVQAKPWWVAHELALRSADDSGFAPASELVAAGDYEIRVTINDEVWGVYRYSSEGEWPELTRQDRDSSQPMRFLEGLTDRYYLERETP